jgi:hypothetical protein
MSKIGLAVLCLAVLLAGRGGSLQGDVANGELIGSTRGLRAVLAVGPTCETERSHAERCLR